MDSSKRLLVSKCLIAAVLSVAASVQRDEFSRSTFLKAYPGYALKNHVVGQHHVTCELACGARCLAHSACLSYNFQPISNPEMRMPNCQLNDANRITSGPESYVIQPGVIYFELLEVLEGQSDNKALKDVAPLSYDLTFPSKGLTSYVSLTWPTIPNAPVNRFTLCFWMKTADQGDGAPFSYSVPSAINEVVVQKEYLCIHDQYKVISLENYYDGIWHHVCVTWRNSDGSWRVFVDGAVINSGTSFQTGHMIQTGGVLLVGQEQDKTDGDPIGFSFEQSFMGSISEMNVWNKVLTQDDVLSMSQTCNTKIGNVLQWADFQISLHGDVIVESPSSCKVPV